MPERRDVDLTTLTLTSDRLELRPWRPDDLATLTRLFGGHGLADFLRLPGPRTDEQARTYLAETAGSSRRDGTGVEAAIVERASGDVIGWLSLRLPFAYRVADIGYWLEPAARGRGYATEAARLMTDWAFDYGVHRLELRIDPDNLTSARTVLRCGYAYESTRRDGLPMPDGSRRDLAIFARTADDPGDPVPPRFPLPPAEGLSDGVVRLCVLSRRHAKGWAETDADPLSIAVGFTGAPVPWPQVERRCASAGLQWLVGRMLEFAMEDVETGRYAGSLDLRESPPRVGGIGYSVHPAFRGRGYTARALRLVAPWAFQDAGFVRLELGAKRTNIASQRSAVAGGFEPDGVRAARLVNADGSASDEVCYTLVNPAAVRSG